MKTLRYAFARTLPLPGAFTFLGILFCCGWLLW